MLFVGWGDERGGELVDEFGVEVMGRGVVVVAEPVYFVRVFVECYGVVSVRVGRDEVVDHRRGYVQVFVGVY